MEARTLDVGLLQTFDAHSSSESTEFVSLVYLHELAHLRRGDLWIHTVVSLLMVFHWFNPMLWLALFFLKADAELAADAMALKKATAGSG